MNYATHFMKFRDSNFKRTLKNLFLSPDANTIVIEPHLGLGDSLICLALVRELSVKNFNKRFYYACLDRCYHSLAWMFEDLCNVHLLVVKSGREARQFAGFINGTYLPIGVYGVDINRFDAFFYEQHDVSFESRWTNSRVMPGPRSESLFNQCNPSSEPFILICNVESGLNEYDLKIDNPLDKKIIKVEPLTNNIFDWTKLVLQADEIHTIDTAFIHFVESTLYQRRAPRLYYHLARKSSTEFTRRLPWQIIKYHDLS